jgi:hypothetical protein
LGIKEIYRKIEGILKYVPYRFLRPFFSVELAGIIDGKVYQDLYDLQNFQDLFI